MPSCLYLVEGSGFVQLNDLIEMPPAFSALPSLGATARMK
jgi:hypothetical protein